jgi:Domain of unknown function (DUF4262)
MKHNKSGTCKCSRCAAIAAGKTPAQADAEYQKWERENLRKHGWICHFVTADAASPTGFNLHTHGLQENYQHADFQIVVPLPQKVGHSILITLADRVKAGERFEADKKVDGVITDPDGEGMPVKLIEATECGRPVLRVILPDPRGKLDLGEIDDQYVKQYDKRGERGEVE